jgi:hypothetical protein
MGHAANRPRDTRMDGGEISDQAKVQPSYVISMQ